MPWPDPVALEGEHVTLSPLSQFHLDKLIEAAKDGELWNLWYTSVPSPHQMSEEIDRRLNMQKTGSMLPFAVVETISGLPVGMTTYMNIDAATKRLEIGSTWYCRRVQRGPINTESKYMLLRHAFENLDCIAVEFRTHFFNHQSRRAIERLGAKLDGVLRNHKVMADGSFRDTCCYSIINTEWPAVKTHLDYKLKWSRD